MAAGLRVPAVPITYIDAPASIAINSSFDVVANITNFGDESAKSIVATLATDTSLEITSSAIVSLNSIEPGKMVQARWTLRLSQRAKPSDFAAFWATVEGEGVEPQDLNGAVLVTFGDSGKLEFTAHSPVLMMVTDYLGRSVGFDPSGSGVLNEIPGANYTGRDSSPQSILVPDPLGTYRVDLLGTGEGPYKVEIKTLQDDQVASIQTVQGSAKKGTLTSMLTQVALVNDTILLVSGQALPWTRMHVISFQYDKLGKPSVLSPGSSDSRELAFALESLEFQDRDGGVLGKIGFGGEEAWKYLNYGWLENTGGTSGAVGIVWAGDPTKFATIETRIPDGVLYIVAKANPLFSNSSLTFLVDGKAKANFITSPGWSSYKVSVNKTMSSVQLSVSSGNVTLGDSIVVSGSLTPLVNGATISLNLTSPSGKMSYYKVVCGGDGRYSYNLKPDEKGVWLAQSTWQGNEAYSNSTSYVSQFKVIGNSPTGGAGGSGGIPSYPYASVAAGLAISIVLFIYIKGRKRSRS
jgi:hypothetical protein